MPSLIERILPELKLIESGPERQRMIKYAISGPRTCIAAFLSVVGATAMFVLWDKLVASHRRSCEIQLTWMGLAIG